MHIPVLLCGFFCGPWYALAVGFLSPLLRLLLFGMSPLIPSGIGMCFELATYGFMAGFLYKKLPKKKIFIYVALLGTMLCGRVVWGAARGGTLRTGPIRVRMGTRLTPGTNTKALVRDMISAFCYSFEKTFNKNTANGKKN